MRARRSSGLLLLTLVIATGQAADLLSAIRLADTIITGERRIAIIETRHGEQRFITEGEKLAGCLVKHIRVDGVDLECRGRTRSLGFAGRARSASLPAQRAALWTSRTAHRPMSAHCGEPTPAIIMCRAGETREHPV